jgi:hypothetical protein
MDADLATRIAALATRLKELDSDVLALRQELAGAEGDTVDDALDHLAQIHFRLTDCKGHLSAVKHAIRGLPSE